MWSRSNHGKLLAYLPHDVKQQWEIKEEQGREEIPEPGRQPGNSSFRVHCVPAERKNSFLEHLVWLCKEHTGSTIVCQHVTILCYNIYEKIINRQFMVLTHNFITTLFQIINN